MRYLVYQSPYHLLNLILLPLPPPPPLRGKSHGILLVQGLGMGLRRSPLILSNTHLSETHLPASWATATLFRGTGITEADLGTELLAQPRLVDHLIQLIHLLERQTFRLVDHEPDEQKADAAERSPDEEDFGLQIGVLRVHEVRGRIGDGKVQEPVGRRGHGEGLGTDFEREELACHDPCDGTPAGREVVDVDAHKRNGRALCGEILRARHRACDGYDELADAHPGGAPEKKVATAKFFDEIETGECADLKVVKKAG